MHRAKLKTPTILYNCWRNFALCAAPKDSARRRSAGQPSRWLKMVQPLLFFLMAFSLSLKPFHLQQVQPAQAQTSGEVMLQSPLRHLLYVQALIHPRSLKVPSIPGTRSPTLLLGAQLAPVLATHWGENHRGHLRVPKILRDLVHTNRELRQGSLPLDVLRAMLDPNLAGLSLTRDGRSSLPLFRSCGSPDIAVSICAQVFQLGGCILRATLLRVLQVPEAEQLLRGALSYLFGHVPT